jgi:hypothetical protein
MFNETKKGERAGGKRKKGTKADIDDWKVEERRE